MLVTDVKTVHIGTYCLGQCCRHHGLVKAALLEQFVADQLLQLPPVPAVAASTVNSFLRRVPPHKVTVLAFSTALPKASVPLRHAAVQHKLHVVAGRVQWKAEVSASVYPGSFGVRLGLFSFFLRVFSLSSLETRNSHKSSPSHTTSRRLDQTQGFTLAYCMAHNECSLTRTVNCPESKAVAGGVATWQCSTSPRRFN